MNNKSTFFKVGFLLVILFIIAGFQITPILSGPGDDNDPVVSLSYLEIASRYGEVLIKKPDEYPLVPGTSFILWQGEAELRGVGDYYLIDLTSGKSRKREKNLSQNHLYVVTGGSDIKILAKDEARLLIRGGEGGPLRKGM